MKSIGQAVRAARREKGMTVKELAAAVRVSPNTIYDWEEDRSICKT